MSVLDNVLMEEYKRILRMINSISEEIESLPKGYISKKNIKGKDYSYLQRRKGNKIVSSYLVKEKVEDYKVLIENRRNLEKQKRELEKERKRLSRIL
jgi:hypothetical protein